MRNRILFGIDRHTSTSAGTLIACARSVIIASPACTQFAVDRHFEILRRERTEIGDPSA